MNIFSKMKVIKQATEDCISTANALYSIDCDVTAIKFRWIRNYYGQVLTRYDKLHRTDAFIYYGLHTLFSSSKAYEHILKNTVPHEVAHVVDGLINGKELDPNKWHNEE